MDLYQEHFQPLTPPGGIGRIRAPQGKIHAVGTCHMYCENLLKLLCLVWPCSEHKLYELTFGNLLV